MSWRKRHGAPLRVAEIVKLDLQLDAKGKIEAYRARLNVSFKFED